MVIYDAERGAFKGEKIVGDLTGYSLNKFGELYNVPQEKRNPEDIAKEYADEWIKYNCDQSLALATLANKVVKEKFPGMTFEVYSGYEYDEGPDIELYLTPNPSEAVFEVWVPIKEK